MKLLSFPFESVKLKSLNFGLISMQWLKTCLSLFLSFAILLVGSAAAASSVHKRCLMPSEQMKSMQMEASQNQDMMHTDCMKVEAKVKKRYMILPVCLSKIALCLLPKLRTPVILKAFCTQRYSHP